jgi:hypothetical protein
MCNQPLWCCCYYSTAGILFLFWPAFIYLYIYVLFICVVQVVERDKSKSSVSTWLWRWPCMHDWLADSLRRGLEVTGTTGHSRRCTAPSFLLPFLLSKMRRTCYCLRIFYSSLHVFSWWLRTPTCRWSFRMKAEYSSLFHSDILCFFFYRIY